MYNYLHDPMDCPSLSKPLPHAVRSELLVEGEEDDDDDEEEEDDDEEEEEELVVVAVVVVESLSDASTFPDVSPTKMATGSDDNAVLLYIVHWRI